MRLYFYIFKTHVNSSNRNQKFMINFKRVSMSFDNMQKLVGIFNSEKGIAHEKCYRK